MSFHNVPPNGFPDLPDMEEVEAVVKDVTALKTSVASLSEDVSDLNTDKANKADIATEFSDLTNYNAGDLVYYEGDLYEFQADHTAGAWETSEVIQKDLSDIVTTLKSGLTVRHSQAFGNFNVAKVGYTVMIIMSNGVVDTDANGFVISGGEPLLIPSGYRPIATINIVESRANKRLSISQDGRINLPNDVSASGVELRFEAMYLTN